MASYPYYPPNEKLAPLGIMTTNVEGGLHRPPGDVLNDKSYDFPIISEIVTCATPENVVKSSRFTDEDIQGYVDTANKLVKRGAIGLITTCGFMAQLQNRIRDKVSVPIASSSLLQIPFVMSTLPSGSHIGVLTFNGAVLGPVHFEGVGVTKEQYARITIVGAPSKGPMHDAIADGLPYYREKIQDEMVGMTKTLLEKDPLIKAIVLECTQMPPFAKAVHKASGLPVYDILTLANWFYRGLQPKTVPEEDDMADAMRKRK